MIYPGGLIMDRIILEPYDAFDISTFVIHNDTVHIGHFGGMYDEAGEQLHTIEEQTRQTFHNLAKALKAIDLSLDNLVKVTVILKNISDFQGMHAAWKQAFTSVYPVRTTITSDFIDDHCLIQIEGVAAIK
jgi:2-iminobutanoate/2-iminopropanoate deaminase